MSNKPRKRKGKEMFQLQALRNVIKEVGEEVIKKFGEKYRELEIESNRNNTGEALYIKSKSNTRLRYQVA